MLRHQLNVLRRQTRRPRLTTADRVLFVCLHRLFPWLRSAITIVLPRTMLRCHRSGFGLYWRWKSRSRSGRPKVPIEARKIPASCGLFWLGTRGGRTARLKASKPRSWEGEALNSDEVRKSCCLGV